MQPRISIITPSFNQGQYLEENILSIINQHYPNVEHIIIDGGSTDSTKEVLEKYKNKLAYVVSEPDHGQSDAVNKGFAEATGDIIGWLNSDDYYAEGAFNEVNELFASPSVNAVSGSLLVFDEKGNQRKKTPPEGLKKQYPGHYIKTIPNQPSTFFRREPLVGLMPVNTTLHYLMDYELWLKYLLKYNTDHIVTTENVLAYFRIHGSSKSGSQGVHFDNEQATMLHAFALHQKFDEIAILLASRYTILQTYLPSFQLFPDEEQTLNLLRIFLLEKGKAVYTRRDFDYVSKMCALLDISHYTSLQEEKVAMTELLDVAECLGWNHFRMKLKYRSILTSILGK